MFVKKTKFFPGATPYLFKYFFALLESIIPGLSLLLKIIGLSIVPVAKITFFDLIFQILSLISFFLYNPFSGSISWTANNKL